MNATQKPAFGFLIVGTLIGAAVGAVLSHGGNVVVNTIVGTIVGFLGGIVADLVCSKRQPKMFDVVLAGLVAVTLVSLFRPLAVPKSPDEGDWPRVQQNQIENPDEQQTRVIAERFLADVLANRLDAAYDALSAEWKEKAGREGFTRVVRQQPKFKNPRLPFSCDVYESNYTYIYRCQADSEEGKVLEVEIMVGRNHLNPSFRVCDYQVGDQSAR
jgi:hypothetical protein